jgi:integrase
MQAKLLTEMVRVLTRQMPPTKETTVFDIVLPRFALRVRPPGVPGRPWSSAYFIRYVGPDGRERKLKIGSPATMDLDTARKTAREALAIVDRGGDPASDKTAVRSQWSIGQAVEAYFASPDFQRKTPKVQTCDTATLRLHVVHRLRHLPLIQLDVPKTLELLHAIETDTRVNSRGRRLGGPGAARKAARVWSACLSWCVRKGQLPRNPLIGALRLTGDGTRETVITSSEDYARLFSAMDDMVAEGRLRPSARALITVAALTGMRRGELQALSREEVDLARLRITLTASKGAKLARGGVKTETVALPAFAAAALADIRPEDALLSDLVFPPVRGERMSINRDWNDIRIRAGLPADLTLHGLRHSAGTVAVMSGLSGPEVQRMLRHRNISTTSKYVHLAETVRLQERALGHLAPPVAKPKSGT